MVQPPRNPTRVNKLTLGHAIKRMVQGGRFTHQDIVAVSGLHKNTVGELLRAFESLEVITRAGKVKNHRGHLRLQAFEIVRL